MAKFLEGKELNSIHASDGLVEGQPKNYDLWITGGAVLITNKSEVKDIDRWLKDAKRCGYDEKMTLKYIRFMIMESW